jgi:hypothetical protein
VDSRRLRGGQLRGICVSVVALIAALALTAMPAQAKAASPVLEYVAPGTAYPIGFTASGGEVTAALTGFDTVVHCTGSHGDGEIIGPRSTVSNYSFTGCETQGGTDGGHECKSDGATNAKEITAEAIEADLVYIDQTQHEVGMLLNPDGGVYMDFKCGGELVEASGPFLSPVGPINKEATSFTATLSRSGATQTPSEYENALGEKRQAIPMGKRGANPLATTGVELGFTIHTAVPLQIKAITAAEIEAKQREDEAAAAAAAKKRHDEEAAAAAAAKERQEEEAKLERVRRALLSSTLAQCRKTHSKHKRMQCEKRAKKKYASAKLR